MTGERILHNRVEEQELQLNLQTELRDILDSVLFLPHCPFGPSHSLLLPHHFKTSKLLSPLLLLLLFLKLLQICRKLIQFLCVLFGLMLLLLFQRLYYFDVLILSSHRLFEEIDKLRGNVLLLSTSSFLLLLLLLAVLFH